MGKPKWFYRRFAHLGVDNCSPTEIGKRGNTPSKAWFSHLFNGITIGPTPWV